MIRSTVMPLKLERSFWLFLFVGIALRCVAINQPLVDAHLLRQCQTADATDSLIDQPGFNLSSRIPWLGDIDERYVQELPLYNYLVMGVHRVIGDLDMSGKVTTILLWAASFLVLQLIWRRLLDRKQSNWANLLFVVAPLGVFYGQAFMPEMLVQLLAFAFILLLIYYDEAPTLARWISCVAVGLIGLLVKLPEIAQLYVILIVLVLSREGRKALWRPRYWIAGALTIAALKFWGNYLDMVNVGPLSFGSSKEKLSGYIGTWDSRFHLAPWAMVCFYLSAFVVTGPSALATAYGLWIFLRRQREKILGLWLLSLAVFYLLWFRLAAPAQSYYNLPALAPLSALFGIGMNRLLASKFVLPWRRPAIIGAVLLVILPAIPVYRYLFRQDRQILAAARWVRTNTQPSDVILFRPNHRNDMIDYPFNPIIRYYGKRPTFVWTRNTPELYRKAALERARYAVVTLPQPAASRLLGILNRFRHLDRSPEPTDWLETSGFRILVRQNDFLVYARNRP
ncbi:MAG TPA: glycosyltransferase family 39 protein [Chthoniobacterales bacterium]|nr:glycosyltransferase family 39 protein [Chthoniobacterales bacterium]